MNGNPIPGSPISRSGEILASRAWSDLLAHRRIMGQ